MSPDWQARPRIAPDYRLEPDWSSQIVPSMFWCMQDLKRVQIVHLGTGITTLRRAIGREELAWDIEMALLEGGLSGVPYGQRPQLKALIVNRIVQYLLDTNHIELYRQLPLPAHGVKREKARAGTEVEPQTI